MLQLVMIFYLCIFYTVQKYEPVLRNIVASTLTYILNIVVKFRFILIFVNLYMLFRIMFFFLFSVQFQCYLDCLFGCIALSGFIIAEGEIIIILQYRL